MDSAMNWILTGISIPSIILVGIWVGRISERVNHDGDRLALLNEKMVSFDKTREDVIRILTILEQSKLGEMNERLTKIETVVKQLAKKEGLEF
jgi:hypothetical protein